MDFEDVIREITSDLSGNWEEDIPFLKNAATEYQDHPQSQEIFRAVGRPIYQMLPEEARAKADNAIHNDAHYLESVLSEVRYKIENKEIDAAEALLMKSLPDDSLFQPDSVTEYFTFQNPLEAFFYDKKFHPKRKIRTAPLPYNEIYQTYAYILVEKGRFDDALDIINKALARNPLFVDILFEKAEIYKMQKDMRWFLSTTKKCLPLCYQPHDVAHYFRNLGFYFIEKEKWDEAICSYLASTIWERSEMAQSQLFYISQKTGEVINPDDYQEWDGVMESHNLPFEPDLLWADCAWNLGEEAFRMENYELAAFCYLVTYNLRGYEPAAKRLEECEDHLS